MPMLLSACTVLTLLGGFLLMGAARPQDPPPPAWSAFEMDALAKKCADSGRPWLQFLDNATLQCGVYRLEAGAKDRQNPHPQDEVYHVVSGKATFRVREETRDVGPGAVLFVAAGEPHRFEEIQEDLTVLVFFSKAKPAARGEDR